VRLRWQGVVGERGVGVQGVTCGGDILFGGVGSW
jgi:hypothetical protein